MFIWFLIRNKDLIQRRRVTFNRKKKNLAITALASSSFGNYMRHTSQHFLMDISVNFNRCFNMILMKY